MTKEELDRLLTEAFQAGWKAAMDSIKPKIDGIRTDFDELHRLNEKLGKTLRGET